MTIKKNLLPKDFRKFRMILGHLFVAIIIFAGGYFTGQGRIEISLNNKIPQVIINRDIPANRQDVDFGLFWRVWDTLEVSYFDSSKLVNSEMVYGAVQGMVAAVGDPYTIFLPPSDNKVIQEDLQGNFEGVGIQIGFKGTQLAVIAPLPNTPAAEAGVLAGDLIIGIADKAKEIDMGTAGITLPEAVQAIRGPAGSTVTLALLREGTDEPLFVDIKRASIDVPSVLLDWVGEDENIAHIQLLRFGGSTNGEWQKKVSEIVRKPGTTGVILDLRNNPGGFLQGSVDTASEFLDLGSLVVIQENADGTTQEFKTTRLGKLRAENTIILVNGGSASASEILAGALRDNEGTTIIGEKTFGKGTIQEPQQINGGAALHITTARWLTPDKTWVDGEGLEPDTIIEDDLETTEDEQLAKAIELINESN